MANDKYELYKEVKNRDDYFSTWEAEKLRTLTQEIMDYVYAKYLIKCEVLQRDSFTCQHEHCKSGASLTIHHFKHKRNGGQDKIRNLVTLCKRCHNNLNRGKPILYKNVDTLPAHIRGQTQKIEKLNTEINWKCLKSEMKTLRKKLRYNGLVSDDITWNKLCDLFRWLMIPWDDKDDKYDEI